MAGKKRAWLDEPVELACRRLALVLLKDADAAAARLDDRADPEALHDFRVAVRRVRTYLKSYRKYFDKPIAIKLRKRLGKMMDATNQGRDDEVHLAWLQRQRDGRRLPARDREGVQTVIDIIHAGHQNERAEIDSTIREEYHKVAAKLRARLTRGTTAPRLDESGRSRGFGVATVNILENETRDLKKLLEQVEHIDHLEPSHEARLIVKRLRYVLEPIRKQITTAKRAVKQLKALQDLLGDLHDMQTLEARLGDMVRDAAQRWTDDLITANGEPAPKPDDCYAIAAVARRVRREQQRLLDRVRHKWRGEAAEPFYRLFDDLICQLDPSRERKPAEDPAPATEAPIDSLDAVGETAE